MEETEKEQVNTRGRRLKDRYAKMYPDRDFESQEGLYALDELAAQELDDLSAKNKSNEENSRKMLELFKRDPHSAAMLNAWAREGKNPIIYIIENFGDQFMDAMQTEEGKKIFDEAHTKWIKSVEEDAKFEKERNANFEKSLADLEAFKNAHNLTDEQAADVFAKVHQIGADVLEGKYSTENYEMAYKAMNYDSAVEGARHEGEVDGRNAKIEKELRTSEKAKATLPPNLGGQGKAAEEEKPAKPKAKNMFGI